MLDAQKPTAGGTTTSMVDTYQMILDVDRIIAEEFDRTPVLLENQ